MSGPATLLATLGALYLIECIAAVPGGHTAFRGTARASWRLVSSGMRAGARGARLVFLPLLPWTRGLVLASDHSTALDANAARARIGAWRDATAALRVDAIGMFVLVFVLGPLSVRMLGWQSSWPFLAAGALVLAGLIVGDYRTAHARLSPARPRAPVAVLATIALSPASAMRSPDVLLRELVVHHHPVVIAQVLCDPEEYEHIAGAWMREQRRLDALGARTADATNDGAATGPPRAALEAFITATVRNARALTGPPERRDPDAVSYCPSCLDEYVRGDGECEDCGGVALERFAHVSS